MKNIHVLPTDKPSRLFKIANVFVFDVNGIKYTERYKQLHKYINQNIYITSDEEIKEGDWVLNSGDYDEDIVFKADESFFGTGLEAKKIILTTDPKLIKDGVQAIDDEFLEWFVKNPSCEEVEVQKGFEDGTSYGYNFLDYKIIIPKEEPKQETLEEAAAKYARGWGEYDDKKAFIKGAKWQQERMYSDEKNR